MTTQPEAILEQELILQLDGLGYDVVRVTNEEEVLSNLKTQLELFNGIQFTQREFAQVLNHLEKGNVFEKSKTLRDRFALNREDGEVAYIQFFDSDQWNRNLFLVTHQVTQVGSYTNRYDVTLLINGLPLVQVELKRRGLELKEAFNQINRYKRHSFWTNSALFQYVQFFVISNGVNTKYYANNPLTTLSFKQTFYWADEHNKNITDLPAFTAAFLNPNHLSKMIGQYVVQNETHRMLMVLRPYQYYAVEAIIGHVKKHTPSAVGVHPSQEGNGYIWHTTGSGKTLTSFKAAQVIMNMPEVHKVLFVVDRKDLDYQTMQEFNSFKQDSVDVTANTAGLVKQMADDTKLIVTTIQKLNNAISNARFGEQMAALKDQRIVFIFDECHRTQFGDTHKRITEFFNRAQLFGFTGTPIFADNAHKNDLGKRTTKDLFGECLHKYVITDAIRDQNVLKFAVEYVGRFKQKGNTFIDIDVEAIDTREVMDSPQRLEKIADYIIARHNQKTHNKVYTAMFAVSSIATLIKYYEIFKEKRMRGEHDLRIATIFSYTANEEDADAGGFLPEDIGLAADPQVEYATKHTREKLDEFIAEYNAMYGTSYSTKDSHSFEHYFKDISKRIKEREKKSFNDADRVDILLVVNMFLTGFDAKKVNTLYVDKNLKHHGLIQAYSRTNRILNEQKSQGNIVCFRNLKKHTDDAIALFSNKDAKEEIFVPPYEDIVKKFIQAFGRLIQIAPTVGSVDDLPSEEEELEFTKAFRELMRVYNALKTQSDFSWDDLPMSEQDFEDYKSKYLDLYDKVRSDNQKEKDSILDDVDFELELIHRDEVNVAYILKLLAKLKETKVSEQQKQRKAIMDLIGGEVELRSKRELIERFIEENLPHIENADHIQDEFDQYWEDQKILALNSLCEEEHLDNQQFKNLIDAYIFSGQQPLNEDVFKCLESRPSVLKAAEIGERIIDKMREFVEVFVRGMSA